MGAAVHDLWYEMRLRLPSESRQRMRVRGPEETTTVTSAGETFLIRTEPAGMPQGFAMASQTLTALSLAWTQLVLRDNSWHLRVRRFGDDPAGPVLHHEVAASAEEAKQRLTLIRQAIKSGNRPWEESA